MSLYGLCAQLLSSQQHYDWGLRALKTVLSVGGGLLADMRRTGEAVDANREAVLVVKSVRVNTLSKLTAPDAR